MAVTFQNSDLVAAIAASDVTQSWKVGGDGANVSFDAQQADEIGDPGSGFRIYKTMQGNVALLLGHTHLQFTGFTAGTTISMGHFAYTKPDSTVVAEDRTAFFPSLAVEPDGTVILGSTLPVTDTFIHQIRSSVMIGVWETGSIAIPIGARLRGTLMFSQG